MEMGDNPSSGTGQAFANAYDHATRLRRSIRNIRCYIFSPSRHALQEEVARVRALYGYEAGTALPHILLHRRPVLVRGQRLTTKCVRAVAIVTSHAFETAERFRIILAPHVKLEIGTVAHPLGSTLRAHRGPHVRHARQTHGARTRGASTRSSGSCDPGRATRATAVSPATSGSNTSSLRAPSTACSVRSTLSLRSVAGLSY